MVFCTFAGHREVLDATVQGRIETALDAILKQQTEIIFYTGRMGEFDRMCSAAVRQAKKKYSEKKISLFMVSPYMTMEIHRDGTCLKELYDDIIIPTDLMDCHYKSAIAKRNRWLVEHSNIILTYVTRNYGGAYTTKKYAERKGLEIIDLSDKG